MKLIIGKNSQIVKSIQFKLKNFVLISHDEIDAVNLKKFSSIFLFSWDHNDSSSNLQLISLLPFEKLIFISSTAVAAHAIRKQWADYPKFKKICEDYVLSKGGRVLRIGLWGDKFLPKIYNFVGVTDPNLLISTLNNIDIFSSKIITPIRILKGNTSPFKSFLGKLLHNLSLVLPAKKFFQIYFILFGRLLKINNYGYSGDSFKTFSDSCLIGFGAFGGYFYHKSKRIDKNSICIVSKSENIKLNYSGFSDTSIGKYKNGLSGLWHGVYFSELKGKFFKKIKFINRKFKPPFFNTIFYDVDFIEDTGEHFIINLTNKYVAPLLHSPENLKSSSYSNEPNLQVFSRKIYLAAGPLENVRILSSLTNVSSFLSDHELALVGSIPLKAAGREFVFTFWPFVVYKKSFTFHSGIFKVLVDFRPKTNDKNIKFYSVSTANIIIKLIKKASFSKINEAFFNRFGIAFSTKSLNVFFQVYYPNCISFSSESGLSRKRISSSEWNTLCNNFNQTFRGFTRKSEEINSIDAQHIWGASDFLQDSKISDLIQNDRLVIVGSPSMIPLDEFHHTVKFREMITK